jgi:hypothetical protein
VDAAAACDASLRAYPGRDLLVGLEDRLVGVYRGGYCGSCVEG